MRVDDSRRYVLARSVDGFDTGWSVDGCADACDLSVVNPDAAVWDGAMGDGHDRRVLDNEVGGSGGRRLRGEADGCGPNRCQKHGHTPASEHR